MISLYTMKSASPNIRKITIMLEEVGLPYQVKHAEKGGDGKFCDSFLAINPNATVPAIVDDETGCAIFESAAILHYLAEKTGQLLPADLGGRGEVMKWLLFEAANVNPVMGELFYYIAYAPEEPSADCLRRYKDKLARYCSILDRQLAGRTYLCGQYSIADIAIYPWSVVLKDIAEIDLGDYSNLREWAGTISDRTTVKAAIDARNAKSNEVRSAVL